MNEYKIQDALYRHLLSKNHRAIVPNFYGAFKWECDMFSISQANYCYEFEIKISEADYKNDFKNKAKHHALLNTPEGMLNYRKATLPGHWETMQVADPRIPNNFFFVTFGFEPKEIPDYAGHIVIEKTQPMGSYKPKYDLFARIIKDAPRIHKNKAEDWIINKAHEACYYRYWKQRLGN